MQKQKFQPGTAYIRLNIQTLTNRLSFNLWHFRICAGSCNLKSIKTFICKFYRIKFCSTWSIAIIIHMFGQFHFSKHNVSFFLAMHLHCYHALEDEAPIRHLTAADHKFSTDINPADHRLTRYFFPFMNSLVINPFSNSVYIYKWRRSFL